jgi:hypothetical protein
MRRYAISLARAALGLALLGASAADAQVRGARQQAAPQPSAERDSLEARVRVRMAQVLRTQLQLSDAQLRQLMMTNRRFEGQKRSLLQQEREIRMGLRDELASGDTARSAQVNTLMDRMLAVQRQRLELLESEQKELSTFLTPMQRARYFGLEEQIRRRLEEMRAPNAQPGAAQGRPRQALPRRPPAGGGARRPPRG